MHGWDPEGRTGPSKPLPDMVTIIEPKAEQNHEVPMSESKGYVKTLSSHRFSLISGFLYVQSPRSTATSSEPADRGCCCASGTVGDCCVLIAFHLLHFDFSRIRHPFSLPAHFGRIHYSLFEAPSAGRLLVSVPLFVCLLSHLIPDHAFLFFGSTLADARVALIFFPCYHQ